MAASGATRLGGGGDVRGSDLRVECKYTEKSFYVLKLSEWEKLKQHAIKTLEEPVLQFAFRGSSGRLDKYAVINWNTAADWRSPYELDGEQKQFNLPRDYLLQCLAHGNRLRLTFRSTPVAVSHQLEVMHWDDYLKRRADGV